MTRSDASDSVGCTMTMLSHEERILRLHWCKCGQPWLPAGGLYGTTEEVECPACILRRLLVAEQEKNARIQRPSVVKARPDGFPYTKAVQAFLWVIDECERYADAHPEHAEAAQQIAVRVWQEAKRD